MVGPTSFGYQISGFGGGTIADPGNLKLLQTQTASNATLEFESLLESTYNVHFFTFTNINLGSQTEVGYRLSDDGGTSYETGYHFANRRVDSGNSGDDRKSTSQNAARLFGDIDTGARSISNGYLYLYNAGDSGKYTFTTGHFTFMNNDDEASTEFGSGMYATTATMNGISFGASTTGTTALESGIISCYGLKDT